MGNRQREIANLDQMTRALALRRTGRMSYAQIAKTLGITKSAAYRRVVHGLRLFQSQAVNDFRDAELDRIAVALTAIMPKVLNGDAGSIRLMLMLNAQEASLMGTEAPKRLTLLDGKEVDWGKIWELDRGQLIDRFLDEHIPLDQLLIEALTKTGIVVDVTPVPLLVIPDPVMHGAEVDPEQDGLPDDGTKGIANPTEVSNA